jgi:ATP-binding cassette subfamily B (MDR/TAP) protein 1
METEKDDANKMKMVSLRKLFFTADLTDMVLMILGTLGAMCFGASIPVLHVLVGDIINEVTKKDVSNLQKKVNDVCIIYCYVGLGALIAGFLQVVCWTYAGERQMQRLQDQYVRAIFSQDISWFDDMGRSKLGNKIGENVDIMRGNSSDFK